MLRGMTYIGRTFLYDISTSPVDHIGVGFLVLSGPTGKGNARASNSWDGQPVQTPTLCFYYQLLTG